MSHNYFGLLDTRNTKYQGVLKNQQFNGIGILIDNLFTTIISHWNKYTLNGYTFIVFPFLQIFYGEIKDNQPIGIGCFQINQKEKIIFDTKNNNMHQMTIVHVINKQTITCFQKNNQHYKIINALNYKTQAEQVKILTDIFKKDIQLSQVDFTQFIRVNIIAKNTQFQQFSFKNQCFFGFKNTQTLGLKLDNNFPVQIGVYSKFPRKLTYGRKIFKNTFPKIQVEQGKFQQPSKTFTFPLNNISTQAQKYNQQYFKLSTIFRNQFTRLQHIDKLYGELKKLQKCIYAQSTQKFGQQTLQNGKKTSQIKSKQYTLLQVRDQIYRAAQKKRGTYLYNRGDKSDKSDRSPILQSKKQRSQRSSRKFTYNNDNSIYMNLNLSQHNNNHHIVQSRQQIIPESSNRNFNQNTNNNINSNSDSNSNKSKLKSRRYEYEYYNDQYNNMTTNRNQMNSNVFKNNDDKYINSNDKNRSNKKNYNHYHNNIEEDKIITQQSGMRKTQLIKSVYEQIKAEKQYQKALMEQLLKNPKQQINTINIYSNNYDNSSKNYNNSSRKYRRYQLSKSPLRTQKSVQKSVNILSKSPHRLYKYSQSGNRTSNKQFSKSPYQNLRSPFKQLKQNQQPVIKQFQPYYQKYQKYQKSHDNLAKYKAKKKQSTGNKFGYLNQNEQLSRQQTPMMELNLFNYGNKNNNISEYKGEYINEREGMDRSLGKNMSTNNIRSSNEIKNGGRDRTIVMNNNKKVKRTYNYVE